MRRSSPSRSRATGRAIRVATFNIQRGVGAGGAYDFRATTDAVVALDADVVALQEVDVFVPRSRFAHQARRLAKATASEFVFGAATRVALVGRFGNAVLVRGAIVDAISVALPRWPRATPRSALFADVVVDGVDVLVASAHLSIRRDEARTQLAAVCAWLVVRDAPRMLLMGDLNLRPADVDPLVATAGLVRAPGGPTRPADAPAFEIDHLAASGIELSPATVVRSLASDHRPLVADAVPIA